MFKSKHYKINTASTYKYTFIKMPSYKKFVKYLVSARNGIMLYKREIGMLVKKPKNFDLPP